MQYQPNAPTVITFPSLNENLNPVQLVQTNHPWGSWPDYAISWVSRVGKHPSSLRYFLCIKVVQDSDKARWMRHRDTIYVRIQVIRPRFPSWSPNGWASYRTVEIRGRDNFMNVPIILIIEVGPWSIINIIRLLSIPQSCNQLGTVPMY